MYAVLAALTVSGCAAATVLWWLGTVDPSAIIFLATASFIISGYLVPNLTAYWLRRPLGDILDEN